MMLSKIAPSPCFAAQKRTLQNTAGLTPLRKAVLVRYKDDKQEDRGRGYPDRVSPLPGEISPPENKPVDGGSRRENPTLKRDEFNPWSREDSDKNIGNDNAKDNAWPGVPNRAEQKQEQQRFLNEEAQNSTRPVEYVLRKEAQHFLQEAGSKPDYDPSAPKVPRIIPAFTRRREIFIGRLAILGLVGAFWIEAVFPNHPNIMQQFAGVINMAGIPITTGQVALLLGLTLLYNIIPALSPDSPTWSRANQEDIAKRPAGPPNTWVSPLDVTRFFGISGWGFSKANELFNGRMAMLGFAAALAHQLRLGGLEGPGPLAQFAQIYLGKAPEDVWSTFPLAFGVFTVVAIALGYLGGRPGTMHGEEEIY